MYRIVIIALLMFSAIAAQAQLPLQLKPHDHVVLIGNTLFDRMRSYGQFESLLHQRYPKHDLVVRNLSWSADEITLRPRPDGFGDLNEHLTNEKADVIIGAFGFNESFKGIEAVPEFEKLLAAFLIELKSHRYNGQTAPRIVLISPIGSENLGPPMPDGKETNARCKAYAEAMKKVAAEQGVGFVDVLDPMLSAFTENGKRTNGTRLTINGIHLTSKGYGIFADELYRGLFEETAPKVSPALKALIEDKDQQFFYHYRPLNGYYITGGRAEPYGVVNFPGELKKLGQMVENRDHAIWSVAQGGAAPAKLDDTKTEPLPVITGDRPINEWLSATDELKAFKVDPRFEVNCFASEEDFPEFKKPIQMRWDAKGRLWVSTSVTYPQIVPGEAPADKLLILEDTNHDGKADKCSVFADKLHIPLAFELGNGGVYISDEPNLLFLKDTDGDGKADSREVLLTGFGTEDSHHALHDFTWSPDGDLIFRESIFLHSQVETPYGPVRTRESSFFRYTPATQKLVPFGSYLSTNPWGICFDDWGFHMGSHPVFAEAVHALNPAYPDIHVPAGSYFPAYSGTCGQEFLHNAHWGPEFHNHFARVRYKPTNEIELHEWVEKDTHFEEKKVGQILQSTNLSFIPVDCKCGPDGALYVADWYNPVKGHMQYSLRDTRRDKTSGRIWRITHKGAKPLEPVKIAGEPVEKLFELLKSDDLRTRYLARGELRERDAWVVLQAASKWLNTLDVEANGFSANVFEALLACHKLRPSASMAAMRKGKGKSPSLVNEMNTFIGPIAFRFELLEKLLESHEPKARAAATRLLWDCHYFPEVGRSVPLSLIDPPKDPKRWFLQFLQKSANDPSGLVRLEAAIAASYIGTPEALEAALELLKHPMDEYLTYALRTALDSYTLKPFWFNNVAFNAKHPELATFLKNSEPKKPAVMAKKKKAEKPDPFDSQPDLQSVTIKAIPERLLFDVREFKVKAKASVKLTFENPDVTPHNFLIVQPGAADEIGIAGNEMAKDVSGMAKNFIPDNPKILQKIKLLNQGDSETLRFNAPEQPGRYPYICSFPGHWLVMKGEMVVE
ncbi:MAG: putative cytochrome c [Verrucomicrobiaceae bacterium]|nr:putative cytochrome c [Verrucomicrobiaceae bacterium]